MAADTQQLSGEALGASSNKALTGVLSGINSVVGVVANWVGVIVPLMQAIESELSQSPDPIAMLNQIQQSVENLLQSVQGLIAETKMLFVADKITSATDRLTTLAREGPAGPDVNEPLFFADVQDAAYAFADSAYWIRPYLSTLTVFGQSVGDSFFPNGGFPQTSQYSGAPFVFDPQLSLPAFMTAISKFAGVVEIFHAGDPQSVQPYFTDFATYLDKYYQACVQGLVKVPIPSMQLLATMAMDSFLGRFHAVDGQGLPYPIQGDPGYWHGAIGAINIYAPFGSSGYPPPLQEQIGWELVSRAHPGCVIGIYPEMAELLFQFPISIGYQQVPYPYLWFSVRMQMGNLARCKALYLANGYDRAWTMTQKFRALSAGQPGTSTTGFPPAPAPAATDGNAHWRLSEVDKVFAALPESYVPWPSRFKNGDGLQLISVEDVVQRLLCVIDLSINHPTAEPPSMAPTQPRPLSLRKTLVAAAF